MWFRFLIKESGERSALTLNSSHSVYYIFNGPKITCFCFQMSLEFTCAEGPDTYKFAIFTFFYMIIDVLMKMVCIALEKYCIFYLINRVADIFIYYQPI